jgi:hypothetical protein
MDIREGINGKEEDENMYEENKTQMKRELPAGDPALKSMQSFFIGVISGKKKGGGSLRTPDD